MLNRVCFAFFCCLCLTTIDVAAGENSSRLYAQGAAFAVQGKYDEAIDVFKEVIRLSPYYCLGHYGLGKAYLLSPGKLDDAIFHLERATQLDRRFARAHFYLGMAYLLKGKHVPAIHAFDAAYASDDTYIEALYNIGTIYDMMGKKLKAQIYFQRYYKHKKREEGQLFY